MTRPVVVAVGPPESACAADLVVAVLRRRFSVARPVAARRSDVAAGEPAAPQELRVTVVEAEPDAAGAADIFVVGSGGRAPATVALADDGCVIASADTPAAAIVGSGASLITYGVGGTADVRAADVRLDADARACLRLVTPTGAATVRLALPGEHLVLPALAAAAVAHRLGVPTEEIAAGLSGACPPDVRIRVCEAPGGWRVVSDGYPATASSVAGPLRALRAMRRRGRSWAVLGPLAEGDVSRLAHDRVGRLIVRLGIDRLVTVGDPTLPLHEGARLEGLPIEDAVHVGDAQAALATVLAGVASGDVVLVKASRSVAMEQVAEAIAR